MLGYFCKVRVEERREGEESVNIPPFKAKKFSEFLGEFYVETIIS